MSDRRWISYALLPGVALLLMLIVGGTRATAQISSCRCAAVTFTVTADAGCGKVVFAYQTDRMASPQQVVVDRGGSATVPCREGMRLYIVDSFNGFVEIPVNGCVQNIIPPVREYCCVDACMAGSGCLVIARPPENGACPR